MKKHTNNDEEVIFESDEESVSFDFDKKVKNLKEELRKCQEEKTQYLDGWQRSQADFINYKKRTGEESLNFRKYANEELIVSILSTLDAFEMSLKDHGESEEIKKWKIGFEHIYNQLKKTLESSGLEQLDPQGEIFDPNKHESIEMLYTEEKTLDHKIAEVVMKGYKIGDKILRAPQVKVWILKD